MQLFHKSVDIFESSIHRGESDIGDRIEIAQTVHDHRAESLRRDLPFDGVGHRGLDRIGHALQFRLRNRPFATGDLQTAHQLTAVVRLSPLIALHHLKRRQLDLLVAREPALAARTLAATADDISLTPFARVDHAILEIPAERASHTARYITRES